MVHIRPEGPDDIEAIRTLNDRAFGGSDEGRIVDALRSHGRVLLSLVAIAQGRVVGHVMYSPVRIGETAAAGLGPMAVEPDEQRKGIGTTLVEAGNDALAGMGVPCIVVLGHPGFYPRCGFLPASRFGIACQWDVPDEVFMVRVLDAVAMTTVCGTAVYGPEFFADTSIGPG